MSIPGRLKIIAFALGSPFNVDVGMSPPGSFRQAPSRRRWRDGGKWDARVLGMCQTRKLGFLGCGYGSKPRTPSEHPNPNGWCIHLPQNGIPLLLTHGHFPSSQLERGALKHKCSHVRGKRLPRLSNTLLEGASV